jgi:UDP:flavonoid glycosyltransferase YjiC (YdhE family)
LHLVPKNIVLTGPLYAGNDSKLDEDIAAFLTKGPGPSILVTMGSSGTEEFLFEAIKALKLDPEDRWTVVVLASKSICSIEKANEIAAGYPRLLITDRFIPSPAANALADLIVTHGGQGTVQCALAAGKPLVGVALQVEQQTNLDNAMNAGAGIRVQKQFWNAENIRSTVLTVLKDPTYTAKARLLAETLNSMDGAKMAAEVMWRFILETQSEKMKA